jgi:hypothetical protein
MFEYIAVLLMLSHFIGDFVLQTTWMAMGKSKSWKPLAAHIGVYTLCLLPFGIVFALVNGLAHMGVDYVTSRINAKNWGQQKYRQFWIGIGADQFLHAACLLGSYGVLTNA